MPSVEARYAYKEPFYPDDVIKIESLDKTKYVFSVPTRLYGYIGKEVTVYSFNPRNGAVSLKNIGSSVHAK